MRRKRYQLPKPNTTFALNITSMTDMFTILLVFLLQTYATSDIKFEIEKDIQLPISNVETTPIKAVQISISPKELKIDGKLIAKLNNGQFENTDVDRNDTNFVKPLFSELEKLQKEDKEGKVFMQADQALSYNTIRQVMYTASMAGFPKLKMATMAGN